MRGAKNQMTPIGASRIILRSGAEFVAVSRYELAKYGIRTRNTGREVVIGSTLLPVYEKKNWDYCVAINRLFADKRKNGAVHQLAPILVEEVTVMDSRGMHILRPQWNNCW